MLLILINEVSIESISFNFLLTVSNSSIVSIVTVLIRFNTLCLSTHLSYIVCNKFIFTISFINFSLLSVALDLLINDTNILCFESIVEFSDTVFNNLHNDIRISYIEFILLYLLLKAFLLEIAIEYCSFFSLIIL